VPHALPITLFVRFRAERSMCGIDASVLYPKEEYAKVQFKEKAIYFIGKTLGILPL
jgi:hypothetical protein